MSMDAIIVAGLPIAVTVITNLLKAVPVVNNLTDGARLAVVRLIAAVFSFLGVIGAYMATGAPIDPMSVQTLVLAFLTFWGSIGVHEVTKAKA